VKKCGNITGKTLLVNAFSSRVLTEVRFTQFFWSQRFFNNFKVS